nr:hypothetical protein [Rhodococcus opacus]
MDELHDICHDEEDDAADRDDPDDGPGMFRAASLVSSASVVTASKPRNEYAAIAAAAEMPATVLLEFQNGSP